MTMEETRIEQLPNGTWKASAEIGTLFGVEVQGELTGLGATKEEALSQLAKERSDLSESMWI